MDSAAAAAAAERTLKSAMHLLRRGGNALRELTDASAIQFIPTDVFLLFFVQIALLQIVLIDLSIYDRRQFCHQVA